MTKHKQSSIGRRLLSAGNTALVAGITTTLLSARVCFAQPGLGISAPPDGASFIAGSKIPLTALVTNNGAAVSRVDFLANGALLGPGQPDPLGGSPYTLAWPGVAVGSYALRAVAHYGVSQTVTSAPVHITVVGGKPNGSDQVVNLTATPAHDDNWYDEQNQLVVNQGIIHTAWHSRWLDPDGILAATNRIYYTASTQSGVSPENWILLDERTNSPYAMKGGVWMAVDSSSVHIVTVSEAWFDAGGGWHDYALRYHRSTDGGSSFEPVRVLATGSDWYFMDAPLIAASQGRVTIAWRGSTGETGYTVHVMNSADNGGTFTTQTLFNDESGLLNLSELRQESQAIALAWKHHASSGGATHIACSTNGGTNYTVTEIEPYIVEYAVGSSAGADLPQVALQGSTVLIAYFSENTNANPIVPDVFVRQSTNGGATFGPARSLTQGALSAAAGLPTGLGAQLDLSLSGNRAAAVFATSEAHVYLARSTNAGASFLPPQQLSDKSLNYAKGTLDPRLAFQPSDPHSVHVMWASDWYRRSTNGGETWTAPVGLSLVSSVWNFQPTPRMVADESGAVHWNCSGTLFGYLDTDVLYRSFKHAAVPPAAMNLGVQFGQQHEGFLRYDNLQIAACPALDFTNALTVECWVKLSEKPNAVYGPLVAKPITGAGMSYDTFYLHLAGEGPTKRWFAASVSTDGGGSSPTYPTNLNSALIIRPGAWYHVAFTFDGGAGTGHLKLYVNGQLQGAVNAPGALATSPEPINVSRFLDGAMDDLRFWNRALTAQEIRDRFTGPLAGNEAGLAAYYTFDGTWADSTGNCLPAVPMYQESFSAGADRQPLLVVERASGDQVRLSWVTFGASYTPKYTTALGGADWQTVPGTPLQSNGRWTLTLNATGITRFFRLERN
jgi:hypothetical protein